MLRTASVSLLMSAALLSACTKGGDPEAAPTADKAPATATAPAATPSEPEPNAEAVAQAPPVSEPEPPPPAAPPTEVVAEPQPAVALEPDSVPVAPIVPAVVANTPSLWRSAATPSEALSLVDLQGGVLGHGPSGYYEIAEDGQLVLRPEIEAPAGQLLGVWPADAWTIEQRTKSIDDGRGDEDIRELRLMRLRGGKRWVPQEFEGEQRFVDTGQEFRKSNTGGLLAFSEDMGWTRVSDNGPAPELGVYKGDSMLEFIETRARKYYIISKDSEHVYVQTDCADEACVQDKTKLLPLGSDWSFGRQATRQRHSASLVAAAASRNFLLHYESGGWKLEEFTQGQADGLWPTKDGGLWVRTGQLLLHRDPDGGWRSLGLPEGLSGISTAITEDQSEVWIAGMIGGQPAVFATHANAQEPAVEVITG